MLKLMFKAYTSLNALLSSVGFLCKLLNKSNCEHDYLLKENLAILPESEVLQLMRLPFGTRLTQQVSLLYSTVFYMSTRICSLLSKK